MYGHATVDRRWFAFGAIFSLFSLLAIPTGNIAWLTNVAFLGFLVFLLPEKTGRGST